MGAEYIYSYGYQKDADIPSVYKTLKTEAEIYSGHQEGYSGNWNSTDEFSTDIQVFSNLGTAENYVEKNTHKRQVMAVRYKTTGEIPTKPQEKKLARLSEAADKALATLSKYEDEVREKRTNTKHTTCPHCGSKIASKYARKVDDCPVCIGSLYTKSQSIKYCRLLATAREAEAKLRTYKRDIKGKGKQGEIVLWYLGGWAAC
jgi:hypothetical protein